MSTASTSRGDSYDPFIGERDVFNDPSTKLDDLREYMAQLIGETKKDRMLRDEVIRKANMARRNVLLYSQETPHMQQRRLDDIERGQEELLRRIDEDIRKRTLDAEAVPVWPHNYLGG